MFESRENRVAAIAPEQAVALLDVERERTVAAECRVLDLQRRIDHLTDLNAAYSLLGRDRGFTEQDARERWKAAGYGLR